MNQKSTQPDFGMFTGIGNRRVDVIVLSARKNRLTWVEVHQELVKLQLADYRMFGECLDTEVRCQVYRELGFHNTDQSFYI
jgi:hypothetical protein